MVGFRYAKELNANASNLTLRLRLLEMHFFPNFSMKAIGFFLKNQNTKELLLINIFTFNSILRPTTKSPLTTH